MTTRYPPGVDGAEVMRKTAEEFQKYLRREGFGDETAIAIDLDMIEVKISGMTARYIMANNDCWPPKEKG